MFLKGVMHSLPKGSGIAEPTIELAKKRERESVGDSFLYTVVERVEGGEREFRRFFARAKQRELF